MLCAGASGSVWRFTPSSVRLSSKGRLRRAVSCSTAFRSDPRWDLKAWRVGVDVGVDVGGVLWDVVVGPEHCLVALPCAPCPAAT